MPPHATPLRRDPVDIAISGILGICGWGGLAINAAAVDTRVKSTVASTMYDMTRVTANGYFDGEIDSAVMVVHGEKAHSRYFGETAFKMLNGENKELVIVPGADHTDLYDGGSKKAIPFDRIEAFYKKNLK